MPKHQKKLCSQLDGRGCLIRQMEHSFEDLSGRGVAEGYLRLTMFGCMVVCRGFRTPTVRKHSSDDDIEVITDRIIDDDINSLCK